MKLIFAESVYAKLVTELRANPDAVGVELTHAELVAVYDEVLSSPNPGNAVLLASQSRQFVLNGKTYRIVVNPPR
jgi:hypothetical protein